MCYAHDMVDNGAPGRRLYRNIVIFYQYFMGCLFEGSGPENGPASNNRNHHSQVQFFQITVTLSKLTLVAGSERSASTRWPVPASQLTLAVRFGFSLNLSFPEQSQHLQCRLSQQIDLLKC